MKTILHLAALLALLSTSACVFVDTVETRVRFHDDGSPPEISITWRDISSSAGDPDELKEDFQNIVDAWKSDEYVAERAENGMAIKDRQMYVENGVLNFRESGVLIDSTEGSEWQFLVSHGERILVVDADDAEILETNGKVLETESNFVLAWPENLEEVYFLMRLGEAEEEDREDIDRNRPQLIQMFEAYVQSIK